MHVYGLLAASESYSKCHVPNALAKAVWNGCYNSLEEISLYGRFKGTGIVCVFCPVRNSLLSWLKFFL